MSRGLLLVLILLSTSFKSLNTLSIEVVDDRSRYFEEAAGSYPFFAQIMKYNFWRYHPSGKGSAQVEGCRKEDIYDAFFPVISKEMEIAQSMSMAPEKKYWHSPLTDKFSTCQGAWQTKSKDSFSNSFLMLAMALRPDRYPFGRNVVFHLPNSIKVKGFLAMKTDSIRRPLVILRAGIFSNSQEFFPERAYFIQLFEQSPFNVLVLESSSGTEFIRHNSQLSIGGFDEGLQNLLIAQLLKSSKEPISNYIGEIHLAGISLGGHSLFPTVWLSELNQSENSEPMFHSVLAFCPLINFMDTFDFHRAQGFSMDMMNYWASRRIPEISERYPQVRTSTFIQDYLALINENYTKPLIWSEEAEKKIFFPQSLKAQISDPTNLFWRLLNYWPMIELENKKTKTPIAVFVTEKDPIVPLVFNAQRFMESSSNRPLQSDLWNMKIYKFTEGYHCSLQVAYDWSATASLWTSFFLSQSPQFKMVEKSLKIDIPMRVWGDIQNQEQRMDLSFEAPKNGRGLLVTVKFEKLQPDDFFEYFKSSSFKLEIPISELDFPFPNEIETSHEARILERWAYQNIIASREADKIQFKWRIAKK